MSNFIKASAIFTLLLGKFYYYAYGQATYFTKIVPFARDYDYAWAIKTVYDGYVFGTGSYCYNEEIGCIELGKIDLEGNSLWNKRIVKNPRVEADAITSSQTAIYVGGSVLSLRPDSAYQNVKTLIFKLSQEGDTIWVKEYGESQDPNSNVQNVALQLQFYKDYLYLLEGIWDNSVKYSTFLRIDKIDTNGVVVWKTKLNTHELPKTFQPISRYLQFGELGNILVCVQVDSFASQGDAVPYQGILDPDGNIIDEGRLFPIEYDVNYFTFYPISGAFTKRHSSVWISHHDYTAGHDELLLYSFDSNHHKIWRTIVEAHAEALYYPVIFGWSNGDMIGKYDTNERVLFNNGKGSGLLRISQDGKLKWKRRYYMYPWVNTPIELNFGWIDETMDGGIIASGGYKYINAWKEEDSDVLLVKLDSMGCPYKDCQLTDTIIVLQEKITRTLDYQVNKLLDWKIINNSQLQIEFTPGINKPELNIILSDLIGRKLLDKRLKSYESNIEIPINDLSPGLYIIEIYSDKLIKCFKFFK